MTLSKYITRLYIRTTGYSYTNLGRLFLRLFLGVMLMQFGIRQIAHFDEMYHLFPAVLGMSPEASMISMITIEMVCSVFIMFGFVTRLMIIPPFIAMVVAEYYLLHDFVSEASYLLNWQQQGFLPIMFLGIMFFILLVGPGKISIDYFLSLHLIHSANRSESELEEV